MTLRHLSLAILALCLLAGPSRAVTDKCRAGASALADAKAIAGVRGAIARACPCFPTFGGVAGGYEVVMAEGFAHVDAIAAEDNADNPIPAALVDCLVRNVQ